MWNCITYLTDLECVELIGLFLFAPWLFCYFLLQMNTFQVVLATDAMNSFAVFLYSDLQWYVPDFKPISSGSGAVSSGSGSDNRSGDSMAIPSRYICLCLKGLMYQVFKGCGESIVILTRKDHLT